MQTRSTKPAEVEKKWYVIDGQGLVVGRLATIIAMRLRGKHKPSYTPHVDDGDNIIVINAEKVVLTGRKLQQKVYHHHTGFIGGIKERRADFILERPLPGADRREGRRAHAAARPARPPSVRQPARLQGLDASARGPAARGARHRRPQSQEHPEGLIVAETVQSLEDLGSLKTAAADEAPKYVQKLDPQGRAYATGKRKDAVARVWVKPGAGKIIINNRTLETYFARPVLRMMIQQPLVISQPQRPVRRRLHGLGRRTVGPGRRGSSRHLEGADLLRAGPARRAQARRLPDPRFARRRA